MLCIILRGRIDSTTMKKSGLLVNAPVAAVLKARWTAKPIICVYKTSTLSMSLNLKILLQVMSILLKILRVGKSRQNQRFLAYMSF